MIKGLEVFVSLKRNLCFASKKLDVFSGIYNNTGKKKKTHIQKLKITLSPLLNTAAKGSGFAFCHATQTLAAAEKTHTTFGDQVLKISLRLPQGFALRIF